MSEMMEDNKQTLRGQMNPANPAPLDRDTLRKIVKSNPGKQMKAGMNYFWAAFALQIIVYAMLSHVIIRYWNDSALLFTGIFCMLMYVPFTIILLRDFKKMAVLKLKDKHPSGLPMKAYIEEYHRLLSGFYRFKRVYEIILVMVSTAIMTWVIFRIYVPGGIAAHPVSATVLFLLSLFFSAVVIRKENKRIFSSLKQLEGLMDDLNTK